ncbi:hypothetical protein [Billgrantia gudaonensis]|uniref:Uncharacterized protein n=1 Tax=Billgrantia gudaonensis TaxID=376427 RepID=A0A1G8XFL1_9GAMM|nr:hypothetical protein [Halomonas gudaonensis]SDJ88570.1 hypothetical protein SAMN04487954_1099 [Halomonas gudaonensis]
MTDKARNKRRPSIYLSPPLAEIADNLPPEKSLSARLATIAERYELACSQPPELTDDERQLLGSTLSGTLLEPLMIKYLDREIEDSNAGDPSELRDLAARVREMSYAERVAMIESLGF